MICLLLISFLPWLHRPSHSLLQARPFGRYRHNCSNSPPTLGCSTPENTIATWGFPRSRCKFRTCVVIQAVDVASNKLFFFARSCLGKVPGRAPFSQLSQRATACTIRMQIVKQINENELDIKKRINQLGQLISK